MKQKLSACRHFKRLADFCITLLLLLGLFPISAFAWPVDGSPANSWYGDSIIGSDGGGYYHPAPWSYMRYNGDGTTSYGSWKGGQPYRHFVLADASSVSRWVYCIESGVNFDSSAGGYTPGSGYMSLLPQSSQHGIMIASLYGWQPGAPLPVGGINENDYYMATQVILWEYQQQLRSDPHSRHDNGPVGANQFYGIIAGRPAEVAYNWILGKIATHSTVPSFTASSAGGAPVHELKWDTVDKVYRLTLTDTNNLNIDLIKLAGSGITVSRSGNKYTFTSTKMIMNPITHQYRKNVPEAGGILIWGRPGFQTMMSGAQDPVSFFAKFKTETYGWANLIKTSEDGIVSGIKFTISGTDILGNKVNEVITTGANGQVKKALLPGTYLVSEHPIDRYVTLANQYVTIESGQTSSVSFTNILKKFRVQIFKSDVDTGIAQGDASLAGAVYGIYKGDQLVDTYTTGPDGSFMSRYYACGTDWSIRELSPSTGYLLDSTIHKIGADPKLYQVELNTTENRVTEKVIYGNVRLIKHTDDWDEDVPEEEQNEDGNKGMVEQPEAGAVFQLYLRSAGSYDKAKPSERDLLTTDGDGFALSKNLPYGRYTVHQIKGAEGKAFIPDFTVFVCHNGYTYSYTATIFLESINASVTSSSNSSKFNAENVNSGFNTSGLSTSPKQITSEYIIYSDRIVQRFYCTNQDIEFTAQAIRHISDAIPEQVKLHYILVSPRIYFENNWDEYATNQNTLSSKLNRLLPANVSFFDTYDILHPLKDEESLYLRTDEEWTMNAAYHVAANLSDKLNINFIPIEEYYDYRYENFLGKYTYELSIEQCEGMLEDIPFYIHPRLRNEQTVTIRKSSTQYTTHSSPTIALSRKGTNMFVSAYFSHSVLHGDGNNNKTLLIIGDNFANSFAPWFTPYYENVFLINMSHYQGNPEEFSNLFKQYNITDCIVLHSYFRIGPSIELSRIDNYIGPGKGETF